MSDGVASLNRHATTTCSRSPGRSPGLETILEALSSYPAPTRSDRHAAATTARAAWGRTRLRDERIGAPHTLLPPLRHVAVRPLRHQLLAIGSLVVLYPQRMRWRLGYVLLLAAGLF